MLQNKAEGLRQQTLDRGNYVQSKQKFGVLVQTSDAASLVAT